MKINKQLMQKVIDLHEFSLQYMERIGSIYTEEELARDTIVSNPIIHLYAEKDTYSSDGELNGYIDSLFFKAIVYDTNLNIKYTLNRLHDAVDFYKGTPNQTKIFKDGSTMLVAHGKYWVNPLTNLCLHRVDDKTLKLR